MLKGGRENQKRFMENSTFWCHCVNLPAPAAHIFLALYPFCPYNKSIKIMKQ